MDKLVNEELNRCGYNVTEKLKKIWEIELGLARAFMEVCEKYDIQFFAWAGTMLGAVRHNGFIPWDDDFDFFVNGYSLENGVVFLQLQAVGGILSVLGGNVTRSAGHTACLVLGAFKNHLYSITFSFLCHNTLEF